MAQLQNSVPRYGGGIMSGANQNMSPNAASLSQLGYSGNSANNLLSSNGVMNATNLLGGGGGGIQGSGMFGGDAGLMGSFLKGTNSDGSTYGDWGSAGLGIAQAGMGLYNSIQNNSRADEIFKSTQENMMYNRERQGMENNRQLEELNNRRRADNPNGPNSQMTTADFVSKYGYTA